MRWFAFSILMTAVCASAVSPSNAEDGVLKWKYLTGDSVDSSPAIGSDGTVFVGSGDACLYAVNPDGTLKWKYLTGGYVYSSPTIGSDGIVYVGSQDHYLYALNPDGTLKWKYLTGDSVDSSPALGSDGTVFVGSQDHYLYALNPDGTLKWKYQTGDIVYSSPALGSDGTVYVGSHDANLHAVNPNGAPKWKYEIGPYFHCHPAIGGDGTVYVGSSDDHLYAINSNGTLKWKYRTGDNVSATPALGSDGTVYVGSYDDYLYAISSSGTLKWKYQTGGAYVNSSPAIGHDGTVYVGGYDYYLYAINSDGTLKWKYQTGSARILSGPALGNDGTLYVGGHDDGYLYAIQTASTGYQEGSAWPCFGRNNMHTSRACPLFISFDDDVKILDEPEYETNVLLKNNSPASVTVTKWTCSVPSATCSCTLPFGVPAGETVTATFSIPMGRSGLYRPVFTFEINDDTGSAIAQQLCIAAAAGSELEHDTLAAKTAWEACRQLDPDSIATRNNYGVLLRYAGEYELASRCFEDTVSDAINTRYGFAGIQMNMGVADSDSGDTMSAARRYTDVLSRIETADTSVLAPRVWYNQAWEAYASWDLGTAKTLLTQTIDHAMSSSHLKAKAYVLRGDVSYRQGNISMARADYKNAVTLDPNGPIGQMAVENSGLSDWTGACDWNRDGIISIIGDVPAFVQCVYLGNCPGDAVTWGDCNGDGILSIIGDVPWFVNCVYFGR